MGTLLPWRRGVSFWRTSSPSFAIDTTATRTNPCCRNSLPVTLKEVEKLKEGETYKKAPFHVASNMLKGLEAGEETVYQALADRRAREEVG